MTRQRGTSFVALLNVLVLFLFSIVSIGVALSAVRGFESIEQDRSDISELAVAMSYLHTRIRQNDCSGAVWIEPSPLYEGSALVISEWIDSVEYQTWIYWDHGMLVESFIQAGDNRIEEVSSPIAEIDGFEILSDTPNYLKIHIWCNNQLGSRDLDFKVNLRSSPQ
jgi:hypothetical protein